VLASTSVLPGDQPWNSLLPAHAAFDPVSRPTWPTRPTRLTRPNRPTWPTWPTW